MHLLHYLHNALPVRLSALKTFAPSFHFLHFAFQVMGESVKVQTKMQMKNNLKAATSKDNANNATNAGG